MSISQTTWHWTQEARLPSLHYKLYRKVVWSTRKPANNPCGEEGSQTHDCGVSWEQNNSLAWIEGPGVSTPPRGPDCTALECKSGKLTMGCRQLTAGEIHPDLYLLLLFTRPFQCKFDHKPVSVYTKNLINLTKSWHFIIIHVVMCQVRWRS